MKIVLTGVETNNKGAELMLYAILQEIERKFPDATVYVEARTVPQGLSYIKTKLRLKYWPLSKFLKTTHVNGILSHLRMPIFKDTKAVKADFYFDASGFLFSDQCKLWGTTPEYWEKLLSRQYNHKAKIVFLPQAFGPFNLELTRNALKVLGKYSSIIMPREEISYNFIKETGLVDMSKVRMYKDFTSLVEGTFPAKYKKLRNGICVIPNYSMIEQRLMSYDEYVKFLACVVNEARKSNRPVFLLNHEGIRDGELAYRCQKSVGGDIDVVTGLNALDVKGLISSAYLVITSRFHGLASAFNSCVPCLATSWSHKYEELFKDYKIDNCVLPISDLEKVAIRINQVLEEKENTKMRVHLKKQLLIMQKEANEMWKEVWSL